MLEHRLAAEILPVRVLHPLIEQLAVGLHVLEHLQPDVKPDGMAWATVIRTPIGTELFFALLPVDAFGHAHQWMTQVDHVFEIELKEPFLGLLTVVGGNYGDENYTVLGLWVHFREEIIPENAPRILFLLSNWVSQGRLLPRVV